MTLTIDLSPSEEAALREEAERAGLSFEEWAQSVALNALLLRLGHRNIPAALLHEERAAAFLRLTDQLMPIIEAGTLVLPGSVGVTTTARDAREAELKRLKKSDVAE